jgi:hypothetical protein
MMKAIMQVGMKPGFCKFKVTAGIGNKRNRSIWQSGQPTEFGNILPRGLILSAMRYYLTASSSVSI